MSSECIETNISQQNEEIETLSSIYDQDFLIVNEQERVFDIRVGHEDNSWFSLTLQVLFPDNYPSTVPPVFEIHGSWLNDHDEIEIRDKLDSVYCEGEVVVFQWVEIIREFMNEKASHYDDTQENVDDHVDNNIPSTNLTDEISTNETAMSKVPCYDHVVTYYKLQPELPEVFHGDAITDRKSTFQAHLAKVTSVEEMEAVVQELKLTRKIMNASHNIVAYRIKKANSEVIIQDFDDDGEHNAGTRLLHLLQLLNVENYVVMVSRWYGGILLGPDRFKHINNCARNLLKHAKVIKDNPTKNITHNKSKNKKIRK